MHVGVLGSMVLDRIDHPDAETVERWGGIAYSLAAVAAAAPDAWTLRPLVKVGSDLDAEARAFLDSVPRLERLAVVTTPEPNNRVHLQYQDRSHRLETLTGGVPGWSWSELEPLVAPLDALFINFISGAELDLDTARRLRDRFRGFLYADFHSLLLGPAPESGPRRPRRLDRPREWLACFDAVQMNERELELVAPPDADPVAFARDVVAEGPRALFITRGEHGATWIARSGGGQAAGSPGGEPSAESTPGRASLVACEDVPVAKRRPVGDPTGCGDVWGAACFVALAGGAALEAAVAGANRAASWNVAHRGADGLYEHLRDHLKGDD